MTDSDALKGWVVHINGMLDDPDSDQVVVVCHDQPHVLLEISVPGIRSAGEDQLRWGRQAFQAAASALQEALDSPSALPGFHL